MTETSVLSSLAQLCERHLGPAERAYRVQPAVSRTEAKRRLRQCAYNALFSYLQNRPVEDDALVNQDEESIVLEVYKLRQLRRFEDADRLEKLFKRLKENERYSDLTPALRFLVALKGSSDNSPIEQPSENVFHYPGPERGKTLDIALDAPVCYGDLKKLPGYSHYYMHFPKELFAQPFPSIFKNEEKLYGKIFNQMPGNCLGPDLVFSHKLLLGDSHEQSSHSSLFGGLTETSADSLHVQLELPDLTSVPHLRIPEFKCRKSNSSSQLSEESGLGSGSNSMSSSVMTVTDHSCVDDSIWERALTDARSQHYTWEWIGFQPGPTERPYLTEAGPEVYDILIELRQRVCSIVLEASVTPFVTVDSRSLVKHILYMLNAVPSDVFPLDQETQSFQIVPDLHVVGISPDLLADFLGDFVACGTFHARLLQFSKPLVLNSFYREGLIFQAFVAAVRRVLKYFSAAILNVPQDLEMLQLKNYFHKAMAQIRYLAKLCHCHDRPPPSQPPGDFPTGMNLLSYLYNEASVAISSPHYPLLLSVLQMSSAPFMLFIRDWVFHGVFTDSYQEFMIQADDGCIEARDEMYWEKAYTVISGDNERGEVPQFLHGMAQDLVTCGKSINLLRICHPEHFMCNLSESELPTVNVTFSQSELKLTEKFCQMYVGRMREVGRRITVDRHDVLQKIEQDKLELQQTARKIADEEISRLQGIIDERKRKADEKKKVEFDRLKQQMEDDIKRRAEEEKDEKEEDKQFIARLNREEDAMTQQDIELEKKARDDLIAYYTELGEEAMHRERVALWKVRRAQLGNARAKFLEAQKERWRKEMEEAFHGQTVLDSVSLPVLPSWVERAAETDSPLQVEEDPMPSETETAGSLPSWARRELPSVEVGGEEDVLSEGKEEEENEALPGWVKRAMEEEAVEPVQVVDEAADSDGSEVGDGDAVDDQGDPKDANTSVRLYKAVQLGGTHLPRPQIQVSAESHSCVESTEVPVRPHVHTVEGKHVTDQTEESAETKPHIRMAAGVNALTETEQVEGRVHIKTSKTMSATKESDPDAEPQRPHLKFLDGVQVNQQTSGERQVIPRKQRGEASQQISTETESQEWLIKKPSLFGHASQLSNSDYVLSVPRLRRHSSQHASVESNFKDFSIKPRIRISSTMSASKESDIAASDKFRPGIRIQGHRNASTESQQVDENVVAIKRFRQRNVKGHSSDSSVQKLLYGDASLEPVVEEDKEPLPRLDLRPGLPHQPELYQTEFSEFDAEPAMDMMSKIFVVDLGRGLLEMSVPSEEEVEVYKYTPLSVLLTKSLTMPVRAQISLVNTAVINYFTAELKVDDHFAAIRRYLLMADGDFAEILSNILLEKLSSNPLPQEILNSVFLNGALTKAIRSSIHSDDVYTQNLSFATKYMPRVLNPNEPGSLKCLELQYNVKWPLNIVLTRSCMDKYFQVFSFLLQLKRVVWVLKDVWHRLKRHALINKVGNSTEFRHLQFHRQEMEHFVKMMQGYITTQVIHVSWQEFQSDLAQPIAGLDQLHQIHQNYINKALSRCLLNKKAEKVMKLIRDVFCLILKFRSQLVSGSWTQVEGTGQFSHSNFASMSTTYKSFHMYSFFLFKVVHRLSQKGYQPHLQELLLQLNFNDYYTEASN
ncbi:gamma-tubulin complex component 6 [Aplysia californica]|uniref:Gamma-tubulin complex component 6 n=1 Tax=Aplysia californica TaxID=6500 RepID=A0ABM0JUM7_APLCA|nr:gamma-tubulin complex component 6 [Aplysia californica]